VPIHNSFFTWRSDPGGDEKASPQGLRAVGPVLPVQIEIPSILASQLQQAGRTPPEPAEGFALIDTGASASAVDESVIRQLGVQPVGAGRISTPSGTHLQSKYPARFAFPGTTIPGIEFSQLFGAQLSGQNLPGLRGQLLALVGRDILQAFVLIYNGPGGFFTLGF